MNTATANTYPILQLLAYSSKQNMMHQQNSNTRKCFDAPASTICEGGAKGIWACDDTASGDPTRILSTTSGGDATFEGLCAIELSRVPLTSAPSRSCCGTELGRRTECDGANAFAEGGECTRCRSTSRGVTGGRGALTANGVIAEVGDTSPCRATTRAVAFSRTVLLDEWLDGEFAVVSAERSLCASKSRWVAIAAAVAGSFCIDGEAINFGRMGVGDGGVRCRRVTPGDLPANAATLNEEHST